MRFLVAGLVLIVLGLAATEYTRRHPSEEKKDGAKAAKKVRNAPTAPPTMTALAETEKPRADAPAADGVLDVQALATTSGEATPGFRPVLRGGVKARELLASPQGAVLALEKGGVTALTVASKDGALRVLTTRATPVASLAVDVKASALVWAEGGQVKSVPLSGGEVKTLVAFSRALVTSVAASGGVVVAALVPADGDPFAADPNGAVVSVDDGDVKLLATEQIRPREVRFDGKDEAFFVAGYPSGLTRAALDGSFTARIAERADGPVALEPDAITYRAPLPNAPELRRGARGGGSVQTVAKVDAEWLAVQGGVVRYASTGIGPRLYEARAGDEASTELAAIQGVAKGLAWSGDATWLVTMDDDGTTTLQVK